MYDQWTTNTPGYSELLSALEIKANPDDPIADSRHVRGGGLYVELLADLALVPVQLIKPFISRVYVTETGKNYTVAALPAAGEPAVWIVDPSTAVSYTNLTPMQTAVGAYGPGTTFSDVPLASLITGLLYAYVGPQAGLSASNPVRQLGASPATVLSWGVTPRSKPITGITVNGVVKPLSAFSGTQNANTAPNTDTNFGMSVTDGQSTTGAGASVQYFNSRYFGVSAVQNPADPQLLAMGKELSGGRQQARTFVLANQYAIIAYPSRFGDPASITINGFGNNAQLITRRPHTNSDGYTEEYIILTQASPDTSPAGLNYVLS